MEWLIILLVIGLLGGGYGYATYLDRKRRDGIAALVKELGLELNWQLPDADLARFNRFSIARKGRQPRTEMTIVADDGETRMLVFDFSYTTGHGKQRRTHAFSMAMCTNPKLKLPTMDIEPQTWQSKIAELIGFARVDFDDDPAFSKLFSIKGDDPIAIRDFLNPGRRAMLSQFPKQQFSAQNDTLLVIRKYGRLKRENVRELMTEALKITHALCE